MINFLQPMEVYVDDEKKLTLHGLQQHYVKLRDNEKNRKLFDLLDALEFNQVNIKLQTIRSYQSTNDYKICCSRTDELIICGFCIYYMRCCVQSHIL